MGGYADLQAGSHPYALTTAIMFNHVVTATKEEPPRVRTYGDPKDIEVNLPQGVIVDPRATEAECTEAELESAEGPTSCPNAAAVGVFSIYLDGVEVLDEPVYNMVPPAGVPAELGFDAAGIGLIMHVGAGCAPAATTACRRTSPEYPTNTRSTDSSSRCGATPPTRATTKNAACAPTKKPNRSSRETGIHEQLPGGKDHQAVPDAAVVVHGRTADDDDQHGLVAGTGGLESGSKPPT